MHFGAVTSLTIPTGAESRAFLLPFDLFRHSTFARPLCPFLSQYIVRQWELILRKTSVHPTAGTKTPDVVFISPWAGMAGRGYEKSPS